MHLLMSIIAGGNAEGQDRATHRRTYLKRFAAIYQMVVRPTLFSSNKRFSGYHV